MIGFMLQPKRKATMKPLPKKKNKLPPKNLSDPMKLAHSVVEHVIGEPLTPKRKRKTSRK
jgi:hypothetical protein